MPAPVLAIDLGGTNLQCAVVDGAWAILGRAHAATDPARGIEDVVERVAHCADAACRSASVEPSRLGAVGLASAGVIDARRGEVVVAENLGWRNIPLRDLVARRLGRPVVLENDVNAAIWGEHGAAEDEDGDLLGVWVGTGVGGGLVIGGRLVHGDFHTAGEIGHTLVPAGGGPMILEAVASRPAMRAAIIEGLAGHERSALAPFADDEELDAELLRRAWLTGDVLAARVIDRAADALGLAIANVVTLLSLRRVVLGGGVTEQLGSEWVERVRAAFEAHVFPEDCRACAIRATVLGPDAGLLGAARLARGV